MCLTAGVQPTEACRGAGLENGHVDTATVMVPRVAWLSVKLWYHRGIAPFLTRMLIGIDVISPFLMVPLVLYSSALRCPRSNTG